MAYVVAAPLVLRGASYFRLSELLERARMSQREVAKASGVSLRTVSRLCTNSTATVALDVLERLAAVLGVEPGELIVRGRKGKR